MDWTAAGEPYRDGFLGQPASAVSSLAFVAAGAGILIARSRSGIQCSVRIRDRQTIFGLLVAAIGVGSFVQHGPHPDWQAYAHDLPLAAVLVFVASDAASDLSGRELSEHWWLIPSAAMVPVVAAGPGASTAVQAAMASAAVGLSLLRVRQRPAVRATVIAALVTAAAGAAISRILDRTALHQWAGLVEGHALWHVLAAAALWQLAPAIGARRTLRSATATDEEVPADPHPQQ